MLGPIVSAYSLDKLIVRDILDGFGRCTIGFGPTRTNSSNRGSLLPSQLIITS
jgi:hypothetical protein